MERILKKARDNQGKIRKDVKVYDVKFRYEDPATGNIKSTCKRGFRKKTEAEAFLMEINKEYRPSSKITVRQYLTEWLEKHKSDLRQSTYNGYKAIVERHLCPCLGNILLEKLTFREIEKMYDYLRDHGRVDQNGGLSPASIRYTHHVLAKALNQAIKEGVIVETPMRRVTAPKSKRYQAQVYTLEEMQKLISVVKDNPRLELPVLFAVACGLRRGEALALTEADIDFENKIVCINKQYVDLPQGVILSEPKSEESKRTIFVPDELIEIIRRHLVRINHNRAVLGDAYQENHLLVCQDNGAPLRPTSITKSFNKLLKQHELKKIRFHDLRHSAVTLMANNHTPLQVVSNIVGHSDVGFTANIYTHTLTEEKKEAARRVGRALFPNNIDSNPES